MKNIILTFCIVFLFSNCASTKNITYADYEYSIDLKFQEIQEFNFPAMEITINNKIIYAVYNTGQYINTINKNLLLEMNIDVENKTEIVIDQIIITNGLIMNNIVFKIIDKEDSIIKIHLGTSIFNGYNVLVSLNQNRILLYNINEIPNIVNSWVMVESAYPKEGLYAYGRLDGSSKSYLFNLGTSTTLYIGKPFNRHYSIGLDMKMPITSLFKNTISLGNKNFKNIYFFNSLSDEDKKQYNIENVKTDIILGYNFFLKYDLFIDNKNKIIYLLK